MKSAPSSVGDVDCIKSFTPYKIIPAEYWQSEQSSFFQGVDWFELLSNTILEDAQELRIYQQGIVDGDARKPGLLLPFYAEKKRWNRQLCALSNYYTSLYGPAATQGVEIDSAVTRIVFNITQESPSWSMVQISPLAKDSETFNALTNEFRAQGWWVQHYFSHGNWYLPCDGIDSSQYLAERPTRLRNTLRRKSRAFAKVAQSELEIFQSMKDLERGITAFQSVYEKSWKKQEPYPDFIANFIRLCAKRGWLRLGVAWLEEKPVAAQIWIVCQGKASIYKLAYDEAYRKLSAGSVLTTHLMAHVLDIDKVREVDYLTGDDPYKQDWMTHRRERWGMIAINPKTPQGLLLILRHFGGAALRRGMESFSKRMPNRSAKRTP
jgi:hypothetical protein